MAAQKFRAIIFDIGRVLIRLDFERVTAGLSAGLAVSPTELWSALENDPLWRDWQEGRVAARDWHLHLNKKFGSTLSFDEFTEVWNRVFDPVPLHENAMFEKLAKRYKLALLSNTDPIHVAYIERNYEFFRYFPARIYSCATGISKPNPLIYSAALKACKAKAQEAIYIDDIPAYVEAAKKLGMGGIVFESHDQLVSGLKELGVDIVEI